MISVIGSSCLVTWLRTNDSCPACRATIFPPQSRPNLAHSLGNEYRPAVPPRAPRAIPQDLGQQAFLRTLFDFGLINEDRSAAPPRSSQHTSESFARIRQAIHRNVSVSSPPTSHGRPRRGWNANEENSEAATSTPRFCRELQLPP